MINVNGKEYSSVEEVKAQIKELEALGEQRGAAEDKLLDDLRGLDLRALEHEDRASTPAQGDTTTTTETLNEQPKKAAKPKARSSKKK